MYMHLPVSVVNRRRNCRRISMAMVELMQTKKLEEISYRDIAEAAELSKNTCYRYFKTKRDIAWYYMKYLMDDIRRRYKLKKKKSEYEYIRFLFLGMHLKREVMLAIYDNGLEFLFYKAIEYYFRGDENKEISPDFQIYYLYRVGGIYGIVMNWLENRMTEASYDMARIAVLLKLPGGHLQRIKRRPKYI